jgi:hypothetical protein
MWREAEALKAGRPPTQQACPGSHLAADNVARTENVMRQWFRGVCKACRYSVAVDAEGDTYKHNWRKAKVAS